MTSNGDKNNVVNNISIKDVTVSAYKIPTKTPESDGTLKWDSTTLIIVEIEAGDKTGIGYTYAHKAAGYLIAETLKPILEEANCFDIPRIWNQMVQIVRNQGTSGLAMLIISALDCALWDLKAKFLELPLIKLLGSYTEGMELYGSGGFTSYTVDELQSQLQAWVDAGIDKVKMKIGRQPEHDVERVKAARQAIGEDAALFVDANGAYDAKQAIEKAFQFEEYGVTWFEEPVSSNDREGLHFIRNHVPPATEIAAGEYGFNLYHFRDLIKAKAVDVMQADITRCGGVTGFLKAAALCEAHHLPLSSHCAPSLHLQVGPSLKNFRHAEYFYDHVRIEQMLFDGFQEPEQGYMKPDLERPGFGLEFKKQDAEKFKL